jgi:antitoxin (DNA-binding transcriptional repressor) of toxin-antitoxin stability system
MGHEAGTHRRTQVTPQRIPCAVRGGQTIAVLDRETPVAHIVPIRDKASLKIRKPQSGSAPVNRVPLPRPLKIKLDAVEQLLEQRQLYR